MELLEDRLALAIYAPTTGVDHDIANLASVNTANGQIIGGPNAGAVTLRSAIIAANANPGADTINLGTRTYTLSQTGNDADSLNGDLDINGSLTLDGDGPANTIIQGASAFNSATRTYTNGIGDKVIGINQDGTFLGLTVNISDVTIRWGNNAIPFGDPTFAYTGAGVDVFLTGVGNSTTFTNVLITENTHFTAYGGGVNVDSGTVGAPGDIPNNTANRGTVSFNGCTISNNHTLSTVNEASGGGINLFADRHDINITNSTITNNRTTRDSANGGGINIRHSFGGNVTINNTNVTNNTAGGAGGGILTAFMQNVTMTGGSITGNTSLATGSGGSASAGGILSGSNAGTTTSLSGVTISNNTATAGASATGGGVVNTSTGTVTFTDCTISNNSSDTGGGVYNNAPLGIVGGSITGNTASLNGGGVSAVSGGLTLTRVLVSNNAAQGGDGGGLHIAASAALTTNFTNGTLSGNTASGNGGGAAVTTALSTLILTNATVSNNRADNDNNATGTGGGVSRSAGTATLRNAIVAGNFNEGGVTDPADDISGTVDGTSSFNLIGTGGAGGLTNGVNSNQVGVVDPRLGPLQNNGGPAATHALLGGSPALDAGSNGLVPGGVTTDQRGTGFARIKDAGEADTADEVDIGAYEAHPAVDNIQDQSTPEDVAKVVTINLGDADLPITSVTATSSNTTLVPNANLMIAGSGSSRTLTATPAASLFGTTTITVTVNGTENGMAFSSADTFVLTVDSVHDAPTLDVISNQTVEKDGGEVNVPLAGISPGPANESGQTPLVVTAMSSNPAIVPHPTVTYTSPGATGSLSFTPLATGTVTITVTVTDSGSNVAPNVNTFSRMFNVTVQDLIAPRLAGLFIKSSGWSQAFLDHVAAAGLGDVMRGYRIPDGADQLDVVPWVGVDSLSMRFSEPVIDIELVSLSLVSVNPIMVNGFNHSGSDATWTFSAPLGANKVRANLPATVKDVAGNSLDGEWSDGMDAMPSGNGTAGGNFSFRFNTLPGDGTQNGAVSITDIVNMNSRSAAMASGNAIGGTTGNYTIFFDINGDSSVSSADVSNTTPNLPSILPAGEPLSATANGAGSDRDLTEVELNSVVGAAIDRLAAAGAKAVQLALLNSVSFQIVDLAGAELGSAASGVVEIDIDGAGHGYFVDDSPLDDNEFELLAASGELQADHDSAAFGRIDLLTVVLHELGHILGYDHGDEDGLLGATLETGVRHTDLDALFADEEALSAVLLG